MGSRMFWLAPRVFPLETFMATAGEETVQVLMEIEVDWSPNIEPLLSARMAGGRRLDVLARDRYRDSEGRVWTRRASSTVRESLVPVLTALREVVGASGSLTHDALILLEQYELQLRR